MADQGDFHQTAKALGAALSKGYADDAIVGDSIGLFDSDTGKTLLIEKRVVLSKPDGPVSLLYTTAVKGRICQVRSGNMHIHYFYDGESGQKMIAEDVWRNGVSVAEILENAPV